MQARCNGNPIELEGLVGRKVVADFDGGAITSDAGALLLRHTDRAIGLFDRVAACLVDRRNPALTVHGVSTLVGQRIAAIALGHEDVDDHDTLRRDPVLALLSDNLTPRRCDCAVLAGKSTLNRLEHAPVGAPTRCRKIGHDTSAFERLFVDLFLEAHDTAPGEIVLDLDATDDPLHGSREGRFLHGHHGGCCHLPLHIFCGRHLLAARLRRSNIDAAKGSVEEVARIVARIRQCWPDVRIVLRADSGLARDALMAWCEANRVDHLFGLARNDRLAAEMAAAQAEAMARGKPLQGLLLQDAEELEPLTAGGRQGRMDRRQGQSRLVVTSLKPDHRAARALHEEPCCARGEMENRIKECQLDLHADRTSAATMRANQLRLWLASLAHVLICALRRIGLAGTRLANATCGTIRLKLLENSAQVRISVRRIKVAMACACPHADLFSIAHERTCAAAR